jgi:Formamidopyrimidine-DNA glycosylase H2TH domain
MDSEPEDLPVLIGVDDLHALDPHFDFAAFAGIKRDVKSVLLHQEIVARIGNIYSDEILFQARIHPTTQIDELSPAHLKHLFEVIRKVLETAIAHEARSEKFIERHPSAPTRAQGGGRCTRCHSDLSISKVGGPHELLLCTLRTLMDRTWCQASQRVAPSDDSHLPLESVTSQSSQFDAQQPVPRAIT